MTYKIEQWVKKITSPIILKIGDESMIMANGEQLTEHDFDRYYLISEVGVLDNKILIVLAENDRVNDTTWIGEEQAGFF